MTEHRRQQLADVVYSYTEPSTSTTFTVFSDASFVVEDDNAVIIMTGYLGLIGEETLIAIGEDLNGTRFGIYDGYYSAYNVEGDVLIGNLFTNYLYDYDEDGTLLSLTDSDGGEYDVLIEDSGLVSIVGPDGYEVVADDSGAFELYDEAGSLVAEGNLNDGDFAEFAQFEASASQTNDTEPGSSGTGDSTGNADAGAGSTGGSSGGGDSGGDSGGSDDGGG